VAGTRSRARRLALQYLYYVDLEGGAGGAAPFDEFARSFGPGGADIEYAAELVRRVASGREGLDSAIDAAAENWDVERISVVERNVLRLGCAELSPGSDVPAASVIDEAVVLAKEFGDAASGGFVNGVLDAVRRSRPDGAADGEPDEQGS